MGCTLRTWRLLEVVPQTHQSRGRLDEIECGCRVQERADALAGVTLLLSIKRPQFTALAAISVGMTEGNQVASSWKVQAQIYKLTGRYLPRLLVGQAYDVSHARTTEVFLGFKNKAFIM